MGAHFEALDEGVLLAPFTVLLLTPFWFLNEHYGLLYTKLHYIGPVESIFEGLEILEVLSEELKLPGLKGLCLEPT